MPKNRKYFLHNTALFVTSRMEEGLPMVPSHFMNEIIWGILARGRDLYSVKVCHFVFLANHFHMVLVVDNPQDVSNFIGYVKAEVAHAVNKLLGRRQKTIWCKGYDSPVLLTKKDVLRYIEYIYSNPVKANLVDSINEYPGVSSWKMFKKGNLSRACKHFSRKTIPTLDLPAQSINEQKSIVSSLLSDNSAGENYKFILEPYAWISCFGSKIRHKRYKKIIVSLVESAEVKYRKERKKAGRDVVGATSLRRQSMLKNFVSKKYSRRMICISSNIKLRKNFISHFKSLCARASEVYCLWKVGLIDLRIPPGLYTPKLPILVSDLTSIF